MPVLPSCLLEPLWDQFEALLPEHVDSHPLRCHNPRIADRVVFEHVIAALVHGSGYERVATPGCSDSTIRRRVKHWAGLGIAEQLHALALQAYDRMIGFYLYLSAAIVTLRMLLRRATPLYRWDTRATTKAPTAGCSYSLAPMSW